MPDFNLTGKTKVCGLIGDPVDHTLSPPMHNAAFRELGLDFVYVPFPVKKEDLKTGVAGLRALNIRGFNVTMPHKVAIIPLLDGLDPQAKNIGAVNTVVNENGRLTGFNTDGPGALQALLAANADPNDKNVVVIGAGGASRAISFVLAQHGACLTILNRKEEIDWAYDIAHSIRENLKVEVQVAELGLAQLKSVLSEASILINATSVGMNPDAGKTLVPGELLNKRLVVFDVIYSPMKTRLLQDAEKAGCRILNGVELLVWQGVLCFEKWTGRKAPLDTMRRTAVEKLEKE
jgi:shikimate dehydrogenase